HRRSGGAGYLWRPQRATRQAPFHTALTRALNFKSRPRSRASGGRQSWRTLGVASTSPRPGRSGLGIVERRSVGRAKHELPIPGVVDRATHAKLLTYQLEGNRFLVVDQNLHDIDVRA